MRTLFKTIIILAATTASGAISANELNYNIYQLSSSAQSQVKNDTMRVTFTASHQAPDSATVNNRVNRQMSDALKLLKSTSEIEYQTGNYQTYQTYQRQKGSGGRAEQQLVVSSKDVALLTQLVGQLQQHLKVSSMNFEASNALRQQTKEQLSINALEQFKQRASLIQTTMAADSYRIVDVAVNFGGNYPPVSHLMARPQMAMMDQSRATPEVASGKSTISVSVSGKIQLVFN